MSKVCYHCASSKDLQRISTGFSLCKICLDLSGIKSEADQSRAMAELIVDLLIEDIKDSPALRDGWNGYDDMGRYFTRLHWINLVKTFV